MTFDAAAKVGTGLTKLISGAAFSVGLMLVVIAGAELFTGNNLMVSSVMSKEISFGMMMKRWGLVFLTNFIGALLIMPFCSIIRDYGKQATERLGVAAVKTAYTKVEPHFQRSALARNRLQLACLPGSLDGSRSPPDHRQNICHLLPCHGLCSHGI